MPHLLRRVAVLTVVSALGIAALTPLVARSAAPFSPEADRLLALAETPISPLPRGQLAGRELSSSFSLLQADRPISVESLGGPTATPPAPVTAPMEATLYLKPTPKPTPPPNAGTIVMPPPTLSGDTVAGKATWYCCTAGYRGMAVVALPGALGGRYDPPPASRTVVVCADRCVELPVVDYCGCHWGTASQKVADLSPEAWAAVTDAGLGAGVVRVTIHL